MERHFYPPEIHILLKLVSKYSGLLECSSDCFVMNGVNQTAWTKLCSEFNHTCGTDRSSKTLRDKWLSVKKSSRRKYLEHKDSPGYSFSATVNKVLEIDGIAPELEKDRFGVDSQGEEVLSDEGSSHPSSDNETIVGSVCSISEDSLSEIKCRSEDNNGESVAVDIKLEPVDTTETQVIVDDVEENSDHLGSKECDLFGEYISKLLQELPVDMSVELLSEIRGLVMQTRLKYIRTHITEATEVVGKKVPKMNSTETPHTETPTTKAVSDNAVQNRPEILTPQNTDPPGAKRFKPCPETTESNFKASPYKFSAESLQTYLTCMLRK